MYNFKLNLKSILSVLLTGALFMGAKAAAGPDSVTVEIGKSKIIFLIDNKEDLENLKDYDLNNVVQQFETLLDSSESEGGDLKLEEIHEGENEMSYIETEMGKGIYFGKGNECDKRFSNEFHLDFGLNNVLENGSGLSSEPYKLRNWGSRYFALSSMNKVRFGKNKGPLNFQFGAELAWNNLMFEDDISIRKNNGVTSFVDFTPEPGMVLDPNSPRNLTGGFPARKSKLTVATIGIPLLIGMELGKKDDILLAVGGYVNYKISSHTKIVYFDDGDRKRVKDHSDYGLSDWRYGLMATMSIKGFSVFGKYDLSPLFSDNPLNGTEQIGDITVYSFGIRI